VVLHARAHAMPVHCCHLLTPQTQANLLTNSSALLASTRPMAIPAPAATPHRAAPAAARAAEPAVRAALPPAAPAGLEQLLSPVSVQEFEADYWEKRPLHVQRPFPPAYQSLLRGQDLPTLAVGLERQGLEVQAFVDCKRCESHGLLRDFYGGGSVVLNRIDKAWAPLGRLCASLRERLHHVFAVMYLTPRGSQVAAPTHRPGLA